MKIIAIDPGAKNLGWCCLSKVGDKIKIHGYGVQGVERGEKEPYQQYRLRLIDFWVEEAWAICHSHEPKTLVSEIIPVVSNTNFVVATQSQLASTAGTAFQCMARSLGIELKQMSALSVKKAIGGRKEATKVGVRNGIFKVFPEAKIYEQEIKRSADLSDAIALGLTWLGVKQ